jgi:hypothetical protein
MSITFAIGLMHNIDTAEAKLLGVVQIYTLLGILTKIAVKF